MVQGLRIAAALCGTVMLLGVAMEASAASARVRCEISAGPRLKIDVDGRNLDPGIYTAEVTNLVSGAVATTEPGKEAEATVNARDVDLNFDSTADPNDDDSFIPANFARPGQRVQAEVLDSNGEAVAMATTTCRRK